MEAASTGSFEKAGVVERFGVCGAGIRASDAP